MSRLTVITPNKAQAVVEGLYKDIERRIIASPPGLCPIDMSSAFLRLCHTQTCGKCVPCRVGLGQLENLLNDVLDGEADMEHIELIEKTARAIKNTADCAIGYQAAEMVLKGVIGFRDDYVEHIQNNRCSASLHQPIPCVSLCPAEVDIPGYIALVAEGRYKDAVRLIRKDNPFPSVCGLICEHPCETRCRRTMIDDAVNIKGLKNFACVEAGYVPAEPCAEATGKKVAVIGGGPSGLSAAYYLSLMGHKVDVYEKRDKLGGMLRYGIPSYRLPREELDAEIEVILSTGVTVHTNVEIGKDFTIEKLRESHDSVYIAIGAHTDKKIGIEGEDKRGVISAVEMLRHIGDDNMPDFEGKDIVVVGGGNVAMDVCRSAVRLGAKSVKVAYRRRKEDMTALKEEVEGAIAEGVEMLTLMSPARIEWDEDDNATALWVEPQIIGPIDDAGRPKPQKANAAPVRVGCDMIIVSIGQGIESRHFEESGVPVERGVISALNTSGLDNITGVFAGGDCVTGPATVIRAIAAGKVAAANIDEFLGYNHIIETNIEIPSPKLSDKNAIGRVNMGEVEAGERKCNFEPIEIAMSEEEGLQEANRCLRCDYFGFSSFKGGRRKSW